MNVKQDFQEDASPNLKHYWEIVVRHRRWLVLSAFVVWGLALVASLVLPAKYKSETVILVEQQKVPAQYVTPNVTVDLQQRLQSLTQQILSRTRLVRIIDSFHLYGKQSNQIASDEMVQHMRDDITIDLIKSNGHGDELSAFKISYSAPTSSLAQEVTGQLTSLFIEENLHNQQQLSEDTTSFLDSQLSEARKDLEQQEKVLGEFRSKNLGELPEQLPSNVQILSGLQSRLQSATEALNQAEQQRLYLASLVGQSKSTQSKAGSETESSTSLMTSSPLDQQIEKMKADLANLSSRYTPQHPDIVHLKEQIANAEKLKRQQDEEIVSGKRKPDSIATLTSAAGQQGISPIAQLESQLKANELEIANRKQEIKGLELQVEEYQARLNLTPIREQQLADVARNHDQSRTNYESLLQKKLESEMATELEKRQQGDQFRIIDPPSLPQRPFWPNRLLFSLVGLAAGALLGFAGIFTVETVNARIHSEEDLGNLALVAVLVKIPPLPTHYERQKMVRAKKLELSAAAAILLIIPALTLLAYWKG